MVARREDTTSDPDKRTARVEGKVEDVTRKVGRYARALRNASGHMLELVEESSSPRLRGFLNDNPHGVALELSPQGLLVRSITGDEWRDLRARNATLYGSLIVKAGVRVDAGSIRSVEDLIVNRNTQLDGFCHVEGNVSTNGQVNARGNINSQNRIFAQENVECNGRFRGNLGATNDRWRTYGNHYGSVLPIPGVTGVVRSSGDVRADNGVNGAAFVASPGGIVTSNQLNGTRAGSVQGRDAYFTNVYGNTNPSERRLKRPGPDLDPDAALDELATWRPGTWRWRDETRDHDAGEWPRDRVSLYVDELPDAAVDDVLDYDPITRRPVPSGERTINDRAVDAHLVAAVQGLAARVRALEDHIAALGG